MSSVQNSVAKSEFFAAGTIRICYSLLTDLFNIMLTPYTGAFQFNFNFSCPKIPVAAMLNFSCWFE